MVRVRKAWGLTRAEWDALPYEETLEMLAEYEITNEMSAYDEHQAKRKGNKVVNG